MISKSFNHKLTIDEYEENEKFIQGYYCPYCNSLVGGLLWDGPSKDLTKKESFDDWLNQDVSKLNKKRKGRFDESKKELDEYFYKSIPLEKKLQELLEEKRNILNQLEKIFYLVDEVLGKTAEIKRQYQDQIRDLLPRNSFYDD